MAKVLVISDTQAPFHHPQSIRFLRATYKKHRCNAVVHIGDEIDNKFLKYGTVDDNHTANEQHRLAKKFIHKLADAFPRVMVCHSNHVAGRLHGQAAIANIPKFMLRDPWEYLETPRGWRWQDFWIVDGVRYEHGDRFRGKYPHVAALSKNFCSTVMGHHPIFGVGYEMHNGMMYFGACVGAMTNDCNDQRMGYGMAYSKKYSTEMPRGCAVVEDGVKVTLEPFYG